MAGLYRVVIPSAGTGSRLGEECSYINKSLTSVGYRPVVSYIIDKIPYNTGIVVALGYKGNLVREFLTLAYPNRDITFVDVLNFEGPGSGLGHTLMCCQNHLDCPFIFMANDGIVLNDLPNVDTNWIGFSKILAGELYRSLDVSDGVVANFSPKLDSQNSSSYVGICGIKDYDKFWEIMENGDSKDVIAHGESYGLERMIHLFDVRGIEFKWMDTGYTEGLKSADDFFQDTDINILPKMNEAIWFHGDEVIKFSDDVDFIKNRVERSLDLVDFVPKIKRYSKHMFVYEKYNGEIMSRCLSKDVFLSFMDYIKNLWEPRTPEADFSKSCYQFYRDKTYQRIQMYFDRFEQDDIAQPVNGVALPSIKELLDQVDWKMLSTGCPVRFHGDLHFENILVNGDDFCLLDWRQDFAGMLNCGDLYYDYAKLLHGMILSHEMIYKNRFSINIDKNGVQINFERPSILEYCEELLYEQLDQADIGRVKLLTAIVFLNMSPLHHGSYSRFLFHLGKMRLGIEI